MPGDRPYTDVDYSAEQEIIAHGRTRIEGCDCGWGMDGSKLGQSHALHVWRELQRAVLPDHDARVTEPYRKRIEALEQLLVCYRTGRQPSEALHRRLEQTRNAIARAHATTKEDHHGQ